MARSISSRSQRCAWPWIVLGVFVLIVIIAGVSGGGDKTTPAAAPTADPTSATQPAPAAPAAQPAPVAPAAPADDGKDDITYEVTGEGVTKANNITYVKDSNFGQQQENAAKLPWSKKVQFDSGMFTAQPLSLVAQSGSGGGGSITCRILRNGEEVTSSTSSGPYAVVTCSGGM